jgi:hypothetical protein
MTINGDVNGTSAVPEEALVDNSCGKIRIFSRVDEALTEPGRPFARRVYVPTERAGLATSDRALKYFGLPVKQANEIAMRPGMTTLPGRIRLIRTVC